MELNKKNNGVDLIVFGVFIFLLRYVPFYNYEPLNKWFSLDKASTLCNTFFGGLANQCDWITPLNVGVIILSVGLVLYGVYEFGQSKVNKN